MRGRAGFAGLASVLLAGVLGTGGPAPRAGHAPPPERAPPERAPRERGPPTAATPALRLVVSVDDRTLWAILGRDTVLTAPVGVGTGAVLVYQGRRWTFGTPRGTRRVVRKVAQPVWVPPDWHYYEVARNHGLVVRALRRGAPVPLGGGRWLHVHEDVVGILEPDSVLHALPPDEEIVVDGVLYIPPFDTRNRRISGALGRHALDLGDGYMLHGTPDEASVGRAATHGCIRLRDADVAWLYHVVPIGTRVDIR